MAEDETNMAQQGENGGHGSGARTAVKAAAAAAATGAAAVAVRKALSGGSGERSKSEDGESDGDSRRSGSGSLMNSIASGGWEAAQDALVPFAVDAAGAAGTFLAEHGPEVLRDQIVPSFISAFNESRKEN